MSEGLSYPHTSVPELSFVELSKSSQAPHIANPPSTLVITFEVQDPETSLNHFVS